VRIVGVSFDSPAENLAWAIREGFPYELWSDENRELADYYSAVRSPTQPTCDRVTKLLDCEGVLQLEYVDGIDVGAHPGQVLEDCEALFGP
jgi:peroxiredoxin